MNRQKIPSSLEREVSEGDQGCVYCGVECARAEFAKCEQTDGPSWEHIVNDARVITRENTAYCTTRGITRESVVAVVRTALDD